jgi:ATP-dependent Lhr-like helicase
LPNYLDSNGIRFFSEGVDFFKEMGLNTKRVLNFGGHSIIFPWCGDRTIFTIYLLLVKYGLKVEYDGFSLTVLHIADHELLSVLNSAISNFPTDPFSIINNIKEIKIEKHDQFIGTDLLKLEFSARNIDLKGARETILKILN